MKRLTQKDEQGNMLKELNEEQRKHRWIPVEERLPEESLNSVIGWDKYRDCMFSRSSSVVFL